MQVTAKVKLTSKTPTDVGTSWGYVQLGFNADYADDRNKAWATATPALSLGMSVQPDVASLFALGEAYTLTFTKSD